MKQKTLAQIARDAFFNAKGGNYQDWAASAAAVVAEHERLKWKPMATLPTDKARVIIGYQCEGLGWVQTFWWTGTEFAAPEEYTHWQPDPEGPKP